MVTDIEGMKKIKANITEVNLVAVPKLVSKINSVACVSFNVATYSQSTLPNVAKATNKVRKKPGYGVVDVLATALTVPFTSREFGKRQGKINELKRKSKLITGIVGRN